MSATLITLLSVLGFLLALQLVLFLYLRRHLVWVCLRCQGPSPCRCRHPRRMPLPW